MPKKLKVRIRRRVARSGARRPKGGKGGASVMQGRAPPKDAVELLLDSMVGSPVRSATGLHTLLYDTTPSMRIIAYKYGLTVGRLLHQRHGAFDRMLEMLERAGMGRVLYSPSSDVSYITSTARRPGAARGTPRAAAPVHYYESGLISGFLSSYTGSDIRTRETSCTLRGDASCTFASATWLEPQVDGAAYSGRFVERAVEMIRACPESVRGRDYYTCLSIQPLLTRRLASKLSRLMLASGSRLRASVAEKELRRTVARAGSFIGADAVLAKNTKAKKSIEVRYNSFNSASYVALTIPVFIGLMGREYRMRKVESRLRSGAYAVYLDFER